MSETTVRLPQDLERLIDDGIAGVRAAMARYRAPKRAAPGTTGRRAATRQPAPEVQPGSSSSGRPRFAVIVGGKR